MKFLFNSIKEDKMKINKKVKTALVATMAVGATVVAQADLADELMKQMDAEIAQVKEETKTEVAKEVVASVVKSVEAAQKAEDAGSEAVVAVQEQKQVAGADPNAPSSFDVVEKVSERTASALKINKNEIGNFDHEKGRIVVIGEATMPMDVKDDWSGDWALKRTMLAKSALLDAKIKLAESLSLELTAEEQQRTFSMPATSNSTEKVVNRTESAVRFASNHPIMGATVLCQEESIIEGEYRIAISMVWSEALQKSAVAIMCGTPGFKESKKGKRSLGEWIEFQENPYLLVGPRQYLDKDGIRHFLGISAMPVIKGKSVMTKANKDAARMDAITCAAFSCLSDVKTSEAMDNIMSLYDDPKRKDAVTTVEVKRKIDNLVTQKIEGLDLSGVGKVFEKEIEHPLFPGGRIYVYCAELNAESVTKARELCKQAYLQRAKVAY